jgi:hypothetical protein
MRAEPRDRARRCATLYRLASPAGRTLGFAVAEEVSPLGASLLASCRLPEGVGLLVECDRVGAAAVGARLRVVRCEPLPEGGFRLDGLFPRRISAAELNAFLGE